MGADQFGGERGKKLKYKQFKKHLLATSSLSMKGQKEELAALYNDWTAGNGRNYEQIDDICVVGIEV